MIHYLIAGLLLLLTVEVGYLVWHLRQTHVAPYIPFPAEDVQSSDTRPAGPTPLVELLRRDASGTAWCHHSWRPAGHPDISEALDTPGLAVRGQDGVQEGRRA